MSLSLFAKRFLIPLIDVVWFLWNPGVEITMHRIRDREHLDLDFLNNLSPKISTSYSS